MNTSYRLQLPKKSLGTRLRQAVTLGGRKNEAKTISESFAERTSDVENKSKKIETSEISCASLSDMLDNVFQQPYDTNTNTAYHEIIRLYRYGDQAFLVKCIRSIYSVLDSLERISSIFQALHLTNYFVEHIGITFVEMLDESFFLSFLKILTLSQTNRSSSFYQSVRDLVKGKRNTDVDNSGYEEVIIKLKTLVVSYVTSWHKKFNEFGHRSKHLRNIYKRITKNPSNSVKNKEVTDSTSRLSTEQIWSLIRAVTYLQKPVDATIKGNRIRYIDLCASNINRLMATLNNTLNVNGDDFFILPQRQEQDSGAYDPEIDRLSKLLLKMDDVLCKANPAASLKPAERKKLMNLVALRPSKSKTSKSSKKTSQISTEDNTSAVDTLNVLNQTLNTGFEDDPFTDISNFDAPTTAPFLTEVTFDATDFTQEQLFPSEESSQDKTTSLESLNEVSLSLAGLDFFAGETASLDQKGEDKSDEKQEQSYSDDPFAEIQKEESANIAFDLDGEMNIASLLPEITKTAVTLKSQETETESQTINPTSQTSDLSEATNTNEQEVTDNLNEESEEKTCDDINNL